MTVNPPTTGIRETENDGKVEREDNKKKLEILRTKGYLKVQNGTEYVVQGVTDIFEMKEVTNRNTDEMGGKLVFIGRGVGLELQAAFKSFVGI